MLALLDKFISYASTVRRGGTTVVAAGGFALSGAAFALGNIFLARHLPVAEYGRFALHTAWFIIFSHVAPLGIDQLFFRRQIDPGHWLFFRLCAQGALIAVIAGIAAHVVYQVPVLECSLIGLAIALGSHLWTAGTGLRIRGRPVAALLSVTAPDWLLLATGLVALVGLLHDLVLVLAIYSFGLASAGVLMWFAFALTHRVPPPAREPVTLGASISMLGIVVGSVLIVQTERIVIPAALSIDDLAMFGILASVAIFPFRMVTTGVGFALVPRLREAPDLAARQKAIRHELLAIAIALGAATVVICLAAPFGARWLTAGKYDPGLLLVAAACFNGSTKVAQAIPRSVIIALGSDRDIAVLNRTAWMGFVGGVAGCFVGARFGLVGLMLGAAVASLLGTGPASMLAIKLLKRPASSTGSHSPRV